MILPRQYPALCVLPACCLLLALSAGSSSAGDRLPARAAGANDDSDKTGRCFAYVSLGAERRIAILAVHPESGELSPAGHVDLDGTPGSLGTSPDRSLLYAAVRSANSVATLRIDPRTGSLALLDTRRVVDNPVYVTTDRTGRHLLTAYYGAGRAAVHPLGEDGTVGSEATQVVTTGRNPHSIMADPANRFVFVPNTGGDSILQYRFDEQAGTLRPAEIPEVAMVEGAGPRHFFFHPQRDFVYFVNEKNSSVTAFRLDAEKGALTPFQTLPTLPDGFEGGNTCADIELTPSGRFLYASNRGHDSIACYAVDSRSGRLTAIGQEPTEQTPRSFNIDPSGRFLYAAGQGSGRLAAYRIDADTGRLHPLAVYDVGRDPAWVQVVQMP